MAKGKAVVWVVEYQYSTGWFHDHLHPILWASRWRARRDLAERRKMLSPKLRREYRVSKYQRVEVKP